jgi:pantoate--beta-alanine ligase
MLSITTLSKLRHVRHSLQGTVGFVPTMGALHAGHMALIEAAKAQCDHVIASIFVNPKQFGVNEDLSRYPRTLAEDTALLEAAGVTALFTPDAAELYPEGFATTVAVYGLDDMLCGAHRPGHFAGVTTVVALLFSLIRPDAAFFGEKDYQQLAIIRQMNRDLRLVENIIGVPTVREPDGLALSSRNRYLSGDERRIAPLLYQTLCALRDVIPAKAGIQNIHPLFEQAKTTLLASGVASVEYLDMRDATTLQPATSPHNARLFIAARLGTTRLIDNIPLV